MNKFFYYNDLFSIYKELLTKKEQEIFSFYYEENLSMGEIAENKGISRSAIGNTIKKVEKKLNEFEQILKIEKKRKEMLKLCNEISENELKKKIEKIINN